MKGGCDSRSVGRRRQRPDQFRDLGSVGLCVPGICRLVFVPIGVVARQQLIENEADGVDISWSRDGRAETLGLDDTARFALTEFGRQRPQAQGHREGCHGIGAEVTARHRLQVVPAAIGHKGGPAFDVGEGVAHGFLLVLCRSRLRPAMTSSARASSDICAEVWARQATW